MANEVALPRLTSITSPRQTPDQRHAPFELFATGVLQGFDAPGQTITSLNTPPIRQYFSARRQLAPLPISSRCPNSSSKVPAIMLKTRVHAPERARLHGGWSASGGSIRWKIPFAMDDIKAQQSRGGCRTCSVADVDHRGVHVTEKLAHQILLSPQALPGLLILRYQIFEYSHLLLLALVVRRQRLQELLHLHVQRYDGVCCVLCSLLEALTGLFERWCVRRTLHLARPRNHWCALLHIPAAPRPRAQGTGSP